MTTLLTPAYRLSLGGFVADTKVEPKASATTSLVVTLDMDSPPESAAISLGQVGGINPAVHDDATIELGYADDGDYLQVFKGSVDALDASLLLREVQVLSPLRLLQRLSVDQSYRGQTAGQIVRDLAGRAKVEIALADDGIAFPVYVVDSRRPALRHIRDLAALCGFDVYADRDGKLVFQSFGTGNTVHDVDYGKQVIELGIDREGDADVTVTAWGESPTASAGADAWGWLTKDFSGSSGSAGHGSRPILLENTALRTAGAAATAASARLRAAQRRRVRGQVLMPGRAEVGLGDAVRLRGVPVGGFDGTYQVRRVVHRITKAGGYTTRVGFAAIPSEALR
jgi:hypothetical protein